MSDALPPIHEWWPHLSIDTRNTLIEYPRAPLVGGVLHEIVRVTGEEIADGTTLSDEDVQYIHTQIEAVD
ncbi:hypothetical protein N8K70_13850 [Microbacterium betulae]|uniref:Uncharacterized protein n=1 Tax=Microbacterium betulae TaxID=2981139 RepID=A0AA97FFY3_9MICO|nr:hypothetical protein [Microbacterium sp. AB]WOF22463.1 hypothetical protein N8K70_13850 [Microbacterium sp. AB]